jgi:hypothetical protein
LDTLNLLLPAIQRPPQELNTGMIGILVTDCLGNPLQGATVSAANGGGPVGDQPIYNAGGTPSGMATVTDVDGIGIITNIPAGTTTIDAQFQGYNMREHVVQIRVAGAPDNALTTTIVIP